MGATASESESPRFTSSGSVGRAGPMVAWTGGLLVVLAAMLAVGHGPLAPPDLRHPATGATWAQSRPAPDAVMAVLRLVVLALAAYLLAVTALAVALRLG